MMPRNRLPFRTMVAEPLSIVAFGGIVVCLAMAALLPALATSPMTLHICIMVSLAIAQGTAWNVLGGYAGQHSIGHSTYFGIGAYTTLMALEFWHRSLLFGMTLAAVNALAMALVVGTITFRLRGPYFVLASISVAEIIRLAALEWKQLTRGAEGILLSHTPTLAFGNSTYAMTGKSPFYYAAFGLAMLAIASAWAVHHSKLGYYFQAIREDQDAAHSLGINPTFHKNVALAISAVLTAWTGSIWALYVKFLDPSLAFGIDISVQMVLIAIIGGTGTVFGPVLGAFVLVLLSETLRNPKWLVAVDLVSDDSPFVTFVQLHLANAHVLFYGILLVVVILFAPDGILGLLQRVRRSLRHRPALLTAEEAP
jgi:branched-chain amino acid transport system permease protein